MTKIVAILTGDLIGSTKAGPQITDTAIQTLSKAAGRLSGWAGADTRFTRYRGDGWQIHLAFPNVALRAAVYLTASLRAADAGLVTRISAGLGPIDPLGSGDLSGASGEAFTLSGQMLDDWPRSKHLAISGYCVTPWHEAATEIADWLSRRWSREQAEAVMLYLDHEDATNADLAARLGISRQAFESRLNTSGLMALEPSFWAFEGAGYSEMPNTQDPVP